MTVGSDTGVLLGAKFGPLQEKLALERRLNISFLPADRVKEIVERRLSASPVDDLDDYTLYLDENPREYEALVRELVERPAGFLADPEFASLLETRLLPEILGRKQHGDRLAAWIVDCGEGYLAYDVALLLWKLLGDRIDDYQVKVFGTETREGLLSIARQQRFPRTEFERLRDMGFPMISSPAGLRLEPSIRRLVNFGLLDPLVDPGYKLIDLVICQGLLSLLGGMRGEELEIKLRRALSEGGMLVGGRGEILDPAAEPPSVSNPFQIVSRPASERSQLRTVSPAWSVGRTTRAAFLDNLDIPVLVLDASCRVTSANSQARQQFPLQDMTGAHLGHLEPRWVFSAIQRAAERAWARGTMTPFVAGQDWVGAVSIMGMGGALARPAMVMLLPARTPDGLGRDERAAWLSAMQEAAKEMSRTIAGIWDYDREAQRLQEQIAIINDGLRLKTEELNDAMKRLGAQYNQVQAANRRLAKEVERRRAAENQLQSQFNYEHAIAQTLQRALLTPVPEQIGDWVLAAKYQPSATVQQALVGGDFYHCAPLPDGRHFVAVGDVAGKGLEATAMSSMAKYMVLGLAGETPEPDRLLGRVNEALSLYALGGEFITLVYLLLDPESHQIWYANAGQEAPVLYVAGSREAVELMPTGVALGIDPKAKYASHEISMAPGDLLVVYTDGLSEAGAPGEMLGVEGIERVIADHADLEPAKLLDVLYETGTRQAGGGLLRDDLACIALKRR